MLTSLIIILVCRIRIPHAGIDITPNLLFLSIHNTFTNEMICYTWTNITACLWTQKNDFVKHTSHLSKGVVIVARRNVNCINLIHGPIEITTRH